jgi:hypothetical protein
MGDGPGWELPHIDMIAPRGRRAKGEDRHRIASDSCLTATVTGKIMFVTFGGRKDVCQ